ncbi:hypothetical protein [Legionella jordanis]|uniref:Uncharacterized protein n=1 Tax=Legionella jordanis TaxID=456 RepID=A0A0W0V9F5_9GAMM|nr:hypothetical protein [Legionella jordanis]KTD16791.1 hypothetical protein Ljor_1097 [Legionella jordanis]RMX03683.1 hypothetical protein EAW55_04765 [Legionella jordanis]RMX22256.1 hypothetical protein EAS68_01665 [Legionella jordanis]VEH11742.1 Uncharacterised protein [Legionella jordanis]HAT8712947.1 hypothetical protein [Legionella jordanis]
MKFFFRPINTSPSQPLITTFKEFSLLNQKRAKLLKIQYGGREELIPHSIESLIRRIIFPHSNCLFIGTTPTTQSRSRNFLQPLYPGHNFSFITDATGKITSSISKRPDRTKPIAQRARIGDSRLTNMPSSIQLYAPRYTTVQEDLQTWLQRAACVENYHLFFHIFPLSSELGLDPVLYKKNVDQLVNDQRPYSLCSWIHPDNTHRIIRASNCNSDLQKAVLGLEKYEVQDMYCQEAAITIASEFAVRDEYFQAVKELAFDEGIEKSELSSESYLPIFVG